MRPRLIPTLAQPSLNPRQYMARLRSIQPASLVAHWPLNEGAGRVAYDGIGSSPTVDVLRNGDFESPGAGGADIWEWWTETASDGAIADETTIVHGGGHAAKLTAGPSVNARIYETSIPVLPNASIVLTFWTRGDGANAGRFAVYDETNAVWLRSLTSTGVTGATYTQVAYNITVPAACYSLRLDFWCPAVNGGYAYFDDAVLTWARPLHGTYAPSGVTYGQPGIGDGKTSVQVSGSSTYAQIGNQAFSSVFPSNVGTAIMWGKVDSAARWTDAAEYRYLFHPKSRLGGGTVYVVFGKSTASHTLMWRRRVASSIHEIAYTFSPSGTLDWFCQGMVWDVVSSPKRIACFLYANGVFTAVSDTAPSAGYGDQLWDTNTYPVDDGNAVLLAGSLTAQEWVGWAAHGALWSTALSTAEMRAAMTP